MKILNIEHRPVDSKGKREDGLKVSTTGTASVVMFNEKEMEEGKQPFLEILESLKNGAVKGVRLYFDNNKDCKAYRDYIADAFKGLRLS